VDSLAYAHEHGCPWDARTCEAAARRGKLNTLRYAHEHGCPWDARTVNAAAEQGKVVCLEYALVHNCPTDGSITTSKAAARSLSCLVLAHQHRCLWDSSTCASAARAGKLECLKYLFEQRCPWDVDTTYAAAEAGKLDCLEYAHEHGCPWVVIQLLALPLTVKSRRCLEYVRVQVPTAVYFFAVFTKDYTGQYPSGVYTLATENPDSLCTYTVNKTPTPRSYAWSTPTPNVLYNCTRRRTTSQTQASCCDVPNVCHVHRIEYPPSHAVPVDAPRFIVSFRAEAKTAVKRRETKHHRYVRRWQEKQARRSAEQTAARNDALARLQVDGCGSWEARM
jgi:hypothetical protein